MIERTHLTILRAIDQEGSLTKAAQTLCLTQSALSHTIKKLEHQSGTALWIKEGRQIRLTQAGQYLLAVANRLLPQLEHADSVIAQYAKGEKGALRIGMECHPCYRWLLKVVSPFLADWPGVDVDVKQKFQFGGMAALYSYDIDILVTPDPLQKIGVVFEPVFDYEQVLVVATAHPLARLKNVSAQQVCEETLYSYPVEPERLDIYTQFLTPAQCTPKKHKTVEDTEIMLQMVAAQRGVAALPRWLVDDYAQTLPIRAIRLGELGIHKSIYLGIREDNETLPYLKAFVQQAKKTL